MNEILFFQNFSSEMTHPADITGYNWYSNSADYSDCLNTSTATIEFWGTLYNQIFTANNVIGRWRAGSKIEWRGTA